MAPYAFPVPEKGEVFEATEPFRNGKLGRRTIIATHNGNVTYENEDGKIETCWWTSMASWSRRWKATRRRYGHCKIKRTMSVTLFRNRKNGLSYAAIGLGDDKTADVKANRVVYIDSIGNLYHRTVADFQRAFEPLDDPEELRAFTRIAQNLLGEATGISVKEDLAQALDILRHVWLIEHNNAVVGDVYERIEGLLAKHLDEEDMAHLKRMADK